jgi:hypothetical protein
VKLYVASSWRNEHYPQVIAALRGDGFDVYDFRNPTSGDSGFGWSEVEAAPKPWSAPTLTRALTHPRAAQAFGNDFGGMCWADACVLVLPCGKSAHLEAGWFARDKPLVVYMPEPSEPELMYRLAPHLAIVERVADIGAALRAFRINAEEALVWVGDKCGIVTPYDPVADGHGPDDRYQVGDEEECIYCDSPVDAACMARVEQRR